MVWSLRQKRFQGTAGHLASGARMHRFCSYGFFSAIIPDDLRRFSTAATFRTPMAGQEVGMQQVTKIVMVWVVAAIKVVFSVLM